MDQFQLLINGTDYSSWLEVKSIEIQESLQANGQTMSCTIAAAPDLPGVPVGGQVIQLYKGTNLEYAGRIAHVSQRQELLVDNLEFDIECLDFTVDLDTRLIYQQFDADNVGNMITYIAGIVGKGFTTNNTVLGPVIAGQFMNYDYPSSFITQIAQSVQFNWYVDYDRDINFFYVLDRPAPVSVIDMDTNTVDYYDPDVDLRWDQVKNVIYITGPAMKSTSQASVVNTADGDQRFWSLGYPPWSISDTTITVDDIPQTILLDTVDGQAGDGKGVAGEVFLCLDNHGVRFPDNAPPPKDAVVGIEYAYAIDPFMRFEDSASIARMREIENTDIAPSDGVHELKFDIPELRVNDQSAIVDYANILLYRYANPVYVMKMGSWTQGWRPGQSLRITSEKRDLDLTMYVMRVTKKPVGKGDATHDSRFAYEVELSSLPFPQ
jgi:hypothetical protein